MGSEALSPPRSWTSTPCIMGIDEAGRGPVLGPMVYGCLYCALSYQRTLSTLNFADSKTLKEEKREELFDNLKADASIGWAVDVIDPRDLSAKMLKRNKINLNEISHNSAIGLINKVLDMGVLLTEEKNNHLRGFRSIPESSRECSKEGPKDRLYIFPVDPVVYLDTVGDVEKYRIKLSEKFPGIKIMVAKKADSLYPVVSGASIVAKVTRDRALHDWVLDENTGNIHRNFGSGYPGDPLTKAWLEDHKHTVFGFPNLVRFYSKDFVPVLWESDEADEDGNGTSSKRQVKLTSIGFTSSKIKSEEIESSGKVRSKFFQARKFTRTSKQRGSWSRLVSSSATLEANTFAQDSFTFSVFETFLLACVEAIGLYYAGPPEQPACR